MIYCPNLFRACAALTNCWFAFTAVAVVVGCLTAVVGKEHIIELQKSNMSYFRIRNYKLCY
jgi:hypothetical protein